MNKEKPNFPEEYEEFQGIMEDAFEDFVDDIADTRLLDDETTQGAEMRGFIMGMHWAALENYRYTKDDQKRIAEHFRKHEIISNSD